MPVNELTIKLAGAQGQGVDSTGPAFAKAIARTGVHVCGLYDFMSRIRGGHYFFQIRVSERPVFSHREDVHLLLAFNEEAVDLGLDEIAQGGGVIYDEKLKVDAAKIEAKGVRAFALPLTEIAVRIGDSLGVGSKITGGNKMMANTAAAAAAAGIAGLDLDQFDKVLREGFGKKKGGEIAEANSQVAKAAYEMAAEQFGRDFPWKLKALPNPKQRVVITGNYALAMGALAAGCRFISAYPMTPASSILEWMVQHDRYGVLHKQTEDELAAILFAIGASHVGARSMTATSGGGFSLMVEALGLTAMIEAPLVIVDAQRPGPATGMPTRSGQADLMFTLHAAQDEFPRIVLAPGSIEECFSETVRAFNLADKYQCPVIVLTDGNQAAMWRSVEPEAFDFESIEIDRGELLTKEQLDKLSEPYLRYKVTESGVSPRAVPGHPNAVYISSSDEHTEDGHFESEDAANRLQMHGKRMRKMETALLDMQPPKMIGPRQADITFVCWGSTYGPLREALELIEGQGIKANMIHFVDIAPFPTEKVMPLLAGIKKLVVVEGNYTSQFAKYLRAHTGAAADYVITRWDGRPFSPEYIVQQFQEVVQHGQARQAV